MALEIIRHDNRCRLCGQGISFDGVADTTANRKAVVVFLRWLTDEEGKSLFTPPERSHLLESSNRQAACNHKKDGSDCGTDFLAFLSRRKKRDAPVVEALPAAL